VIIECDVYAMPQYVQMTKANIHFVSRQKANLNLYCSTLTGYDMRWKTDRDGWMKLKYIFFPPQ